MACNYPLTAYQKIGGDGKPSKHLSFKIPGSPNFRTLQIPCGQCMECRLTIARHWATRMYHEAQLHQHNCFLTLTYNNDHLPHDLSIDKDHIQRFLKRLRHHMGPFSYYAVGEYGESTHRPHYHACIFGLDFPDKKQFKKMASYWLYTSAKLTQIWGYGNCLIGALTYETAQYTAKYVTKKVLQGGGIYMRLDEESGELFPVIQPDSWMSTNPAIAKEWVKRYSGDLIKDYIVIRTKKTNLPKYYDKLMETLHKETHTKNKENRIKNAKQHTKKQLHAREQITRARIKKRNTT